MNFYNKFTAKVIVYMTVQNAVSRMGTEIGDITHTVNFTANEFKNTKFTQKVTGSNTAADEVLSPLPHRSGLVRALPSGAGRYEVAPKRLELQF